MNESSFPEDALTNASKEEIMAALFAHLVIQQTNMAMMMMGKMAHPETGQAYKDLESAKLFIDQLEMLEFKTRGNLDKREEQLLKQSLTGVRLAFVEAMEAEPGSAKGEPPAAQPASPRPATPERTPAAEDRAKPAASPSGGEDAESRKKFSKKY